MAGTNIYIYIHEVFCCASHSACPQVGNRKQRSNCISSTANGLMILTTAQDGMRKEETWILFPTPFYFALILK